MLSIGLDLDAYPLKQPLVPNSFHRVCFVVMYKVALACGVVTHAHPSALLYHLDHVWPEAATLLPSLQSSEGSSSGSTTNGHGTDASSLSQEPMSTDPAPQKSLAGDEATSFTFAAATPAAATLVQQKVPWCSSALAEVGPPEEALGLLENFPGLLVNNDSRQGEEGAARSSGDVSRAIRAMALELAASGGHSNLCASNSTSGVVYGTQSLYLMLRSHQVRNVVQQSVACACSSLPAASFSLRSALV